MNKKGILDFHQAKPKQSVLHCTEDLNSEITKVQKRKEGGMLVTTHK